MTNITPFNFESRPVRISDRDGQTWFALADVCAILDIANVGNASARLDDDERDSIRNTDANRGRGNPDMIVISESGLFKLILRSRKPAAKRFTKWVTAEVLPSIRRSGQYGHAAAPLDLSDPAVLQRLLLEHTGRALALENRNDQLTAQAAALAQLTQAEGALSITDAAKALATGPRALFAWLDRQQWIYRRQGGARWLGYQSKISAGLITHKVTRLERPGQPAKFVEQVLLTPKGVAKIAEIMASDRADTGRGRQPS